MCRHKPVTPGLVGLRQEDCQSSRPTWAQHTQTNKRKTVERKEKQREGALGWATTHPAPQKSLSNPRGSSDHVMLTQRTLWKPSSCSSSPRCPVPALLQEEEVSDHCHRPLQLPGNGNQIHITQTYTFASSWHFLFRVLLASRTQALSSF